jgi:glycosyltransferase involved in cell wall biosynthesis
VEDIECKKVVQHHGLDVLQLMNGRSKFIRKIQRRFVIRNTIKHLNNVDVNIGVSHLVLEQLSKYVAYNPQEEFVLYNGVDTSKFFQKVVEENSLFTLGCVANFWKIKNQIFLIKAVQKIIERGVKIKLRLIGSGRTLQFCKKYVSHHELSEYILFDSNIAHEKLNDFYNKIDLFVLPSYYEALGCVYLESWATYTPFIGVIGQGISEIVPDKERMLVVHDDIEDLVAKIMYFMKNNVKLDAIKNFTIEKTINEFLSLDIFQEND